MISWWWLLVEAIGLFAIGFAWAAIKHDGIYMNHTTGRYEKYERKGHSQ
jgi:hypothetical protein